MFPKNSGTSRELTMFPASPVCGEQLGFGRKKAENRKFAESSLRRPALGMVS